MKNALVEACRKEKNSADPKVTNQDICNATGLSETAVNNFLRGSTKDPPLSTAVAIAKYFGVSVDLACGIKTDSIGEKLYTELRRTQDELDAKTRDLEAVQKELVYYGRALRMHRIVTMILLALLAVVVIALIADLLNPNVGWIRKAYGYLGGFLTRRKGGGL